MAKFQKSKITFRSSVDQIKKGKCKERAVPPLQ